MKQLSRSRETSMPRLRTCSRRPRSDLQGTRVARPSYFQVLFRRWVVRKGAKVAIWALAHRMLRVIWKVLHQKVRYVEHGLRSCNPQALHKRKKPLLYEFRRLG